MGEFLPNRFCSTSSAFLHGRAITQDRGVGRRALDALLPTVDAAAAETTTSSSDGAGRADGYDASSSALAASLSPLKSELMTLESSHYDLLASRDVLLGSIRVAMSCLPPPGPLPPLLPHQIVIIGRFLRIYNQLCIKISFNTVSSKCS